MATVFPADADLEFRIGLAAFGNRQLHQLADPFLIQHLERIVDEDAGFVGPSTKSLKSSLAAANKNRTTTNSDNKTVHTRRI